MNNLESTLLTAGIGLTSSVVVDNAPLNDWISAVTQLVIAVATLIKLFPTKNKKS